MPPPLPGEIFGLMNGFLNIIVLKLSPHQVPYFLGFRYQKTGFPMTDPWHWYIYLHFQTHKNQPFIGKYSNPMGSVIDFMVHVIHGNRPRDQGERHPGCPEARKWLGSIVLFHL